MTNAFRLASLPLSLVQCEGAGREADDVACILGGGAPRILFPGDPAGPHFCEFVRHDDRPLAVGCHKMLETNLLARRNTSKKTIAPLYARSP